MKRTFPNSHNILAMECLERVLSLEKTRKSLLMHDSGSRFPAFASLQLDLSSAPFTVLLDPG